MITLFLFSTNTFLIIQRNRATIVLDAYTKVEDFFYAVNFTVSDSNSVHENLKCYRKILYFEDLCSKFKGKESLL